MTIPLIDKAARLISELKSGKLSEADFHKQETMLTQTYAEELIAQTPNIYTLLRQKPDLTPRSEEDALALRYVITPIAYRLGYSSYGAELQQLSFEKLLPTLHTRITQKLEQLFSTQTKQGGLNALLEKALRRYKYGPRAASKNKLDVWNYTYRLKSVHSIWKKAGSVASLEQMDLLQFGKVVHDFVGITYEMKFPKDGNRYDALISGVRMVEIDDTVLEYKNQYHTAKSAEFELEPIVKFKCNLEGIPVDLQIHGGLIFGFMAASVYYKYKGFDFDEIKAHLSKEEWYRRIGLAIELYEQGTPEKLHEIMALEVADGGYMYDPIQPYKADSKPLLAENINYKLPGTDKPVWQLPQYVF